jgi:tRNA A58 N-methylase Trm61
MILKTAFQDQGHIAAAERKMEALKHSTCNFSSNLVEFLPCTVDVQLNDLTEHTALMQDLYQKIKDALFLPDNMSQQF